MEFLFRISRFTKKTAKKILKPFFAGLAAAAVIASVGICKAEIDNYKLSHIPEVSELKQVRNEFGFDRAREIIYKDQGFYESLIEEYSAKRQDAKKIMLYGLGVGTSTAAAAFALVGIPIFRSRKKRFALEEALNKEGLSLAMLEGDSD